MVLYFIFLQSVCHRKKHFSTGKELIINFKTFAQEALLGMLTKLKIYFSRTDKFLFFTSILLNVPRHKICEPLRQAIEIEK
jgi:hypothetical protein